MCAPPYGMKVCEGHQHELERVQILTVFVVMATNLRA